MNKTVFHNFFTLIITLVWFINGLFCKILNFVPRHQEIVSKILGVEFARIFTVLIGLSEILIAIWTISKIKTKLNAVTQIIIVSTMNILEYILVPDLLLWGKFNSLFAFMFLLVIYFNEFYLNKIKN